MLELTDLDGLDQCQLEVLPIDDLVDLYTRTERGGEKRDVFILLCLVLYKQRTDSSPTVSLAWLLELFGQPAYWGKGESVCELFYPCCGDAKIANLTVQNERVTEFGTIEPDHFYRDVAHYFSLPPVL